VVAIVALADADRRARNAPVDPLPIALPTHAAPAPSSATTTAVWLDGRIVDLDGLDPEAIPDELLDHDSLVHDELAADEATPTSGILPANDLGWVDNLDDKAVERAERWLARKKT
jgi:hypothetical protein